MRFLLLDIETTPLTARTWGLFQQNISIGQIVQSTEMMCFGAQWLGSKQVVFRSTHHHGKQKMLEDLWELMNEADVLVGWNSKAFDHKHIMREFVEAGMPPPSPTKDMDLMLACRRRFRFPSNKLDYVAQQLGVGAKVKHDGFELWVKCMAGNQKAWAVMRRYQIEDVRLLDKLYEVLQPWIPNHPNVSDDADSPQCPTCASGRVQRRGYQTSNAMRYQRYHCQNCGSWSRGKTGKPLNQTRTI